jgi:hypothetical protein
MAAMIVLTTGWIFLVFAGSAHAGGRHLVSSLADGFIILALYASGFSLLLWHYHPISLILGLAVAIHFCGIYAASFSHRRA